MLFSWAFVLLLVAGGGADAVPGGPGDATDDCSLLEPEVRDALRRELEQDNCIRELEVRQLPAPHESVVTNFRLYVAHSTVPPFSQT